MTDDNVRPKPRRSAEYVRLFHPDPVRPARMFSPQNFRQFGVECTLCSLGFSWSIFRYPAIVDKTQVRLFWTSTP